MSRHLRHTVQLALLLVVCLVGLGQSQQAPAFQPPLNDPRLQGLQFWWRAVPGQTEGLTLFDQTPNRNDGTLTNMGYGSPSGWAGTDRQGGYAHLEFDGSNDYVATTQNAGISQATPFTLCAWAYARATPGGDLTIFSTQNPSAPGDGLLLTWGEGDGSPMFYLAGTGGGAIIVRSGIVSPLQTWTHVCASYDGSNTAAGVTFVINGQVATPSIVNSPAGTVNDRPWILGANSNGTGGFFPGGLDDMMVFTRVLAPLELQALYEWSRQGYTTPESGQLQLLAQNVPDPPAGGLSPYIRDPFLGPQGSVPSARHRDLVGWWLAVQGLDDTTLWHDLSPTSATATLTQMGYDGTSGWGSTTRAGGAAQVAFDGIDDYVYVGPNTAFDLPNQTFTLSLWVRATAQGYLVTKRLGAVGPGGWFVRLQSDGSLTARIIDSGDGVVVQQNSLSTTWLDGFWHHLAVVYTTDTVTAANNDIHLYRDGLPDDGGYAATSGLPYATCPCDLVFGCTSNLQAGTFLTGALDDVRIYSGSLSAAEIALVAQQGALTLAAVPAAEGIPMAKAGAPGSFLPFFR